MIGRASWRSACRLAPGCRGTVSWWLRARFGGCRRPFGGKGVEGVASFAAQRLVRLLVCDLLGGGWLNLMAVASLIRCECGDGGGGSVLELPCTAPLIARIIDRCMRGHYWGSLWHEHVWAWCTVSGKATAPSLSTTSIATTTLAAGTLRCDLHAMTAHKLVGWVRKLTHRARGHGVRTWCHHRPSDNNFEIVC